VPDAFEEPDEQASIERRVVDGQDPGGRHVGATSPEGAAISVAWSASGATGFEM
jgi:hypothetical protein